MPKIEGYTINFGEFTGTERQIYYANRLRRYYVSHCSNVFNDYQNGAIAEDDLNEYETIIINGGNCSYAIPKLKYIVEQIESSEWESGREKEEPFRISVLKSHDNSCYFCGQKFALSEMQAPTIEGFGYEGYIPVCERCRKKTYKPSRLSPYFDKLVAESFIEDNYKYDYSFSGELNFCNHSVVKEYVKEYAEKVIGLSVYPEMMVQSFFANRRRRIILDYMKLGYPKAKIKEETNFSQGMIDEVYSDPEGTRQKIYESQREYSILF